MDSYNGCKIRKHGQAGFWAFHMNSTHKNSTTLPADKLLYFHFDFWTGSSVANLLLCNHSCNTVFTLNMGGGWIVKGLGLQVKLCCLKWTKLAEDTQSKLLQAKKLPASCRHQNLVTRNFLVHKQLHCCVLRNTVWLVIGNASTLSPRSGLWLELECDVPVWCVRKNSRKQDLLNMSYSYGFVCFHRSNII